MKKTTNIMIIVLIAALCMSCQQDSQNHFNGKDEGKNHTNVENGNTNFSASVVYGEDDRQDVYAVQNPLHLRLAQSTAALIDTSLIKPINDEITHVEGFNFGAKKNLCESERFREQNVSAFCSGFLVGPNLLATAGHCIQPGRTCENTKFLFGFSIFNKGQQSETYLNQDIYSCKRVIQSQEFAEDYGPDFALVELDRNVIGREPLELRRSGKVSVGEPLVVIGHPSGLPTKIAPGANVRSSDPDAYFVANLDTYGGNSGSAVFNDQTGLVEGILVRGEIDYKAKAGENCVITNQCKSDECMGEHVTRISKLIPFLDGAI